MRRAALVIVSILLTLAGGGQVCARQARQAHQPVVVELFTAQGCSSCVAADKLFGEIAQKPNVLALTLAVDYWDYLGWNDTFAKPEFSDRQKAYMKRLALRDLRTPQVIVDGTGQAAGADGKKIEALIREAGAQKPAPPRLRRLKSGKVLVGNGASPRGGADVWLVRYDPSVQEVVVKKGENRGQTLAQKNVVRALVRLGGWYGKEKVYPVPADEASSTLKSIVLVQQRGGGRILGVLEKP
jgi:hypothetical protein